MSETEGLCHQCGWSVPYLVRRRRPQKASASFTERYRGTIHDSGVPLEVARHAGIARGRTFVLVGALAVAALFAIILAAGPSA